MASESKEEQILELFLENSPLRQWHFEEIVKSSKTTRAAANKWLKRYLKLGIIKRIKEKGKFPYFTCGPDNLLYKAKKKIYMLNKLYKSGLISYLMNTDAKTIILFGSAAKGDWYKESDIDIFVYGKSNRLEKHKFELRLKKDIELHTFETKKDIKKVKTGLIKNIIDGYIIKGSIKDLIDIG